MQNQDISSIRKWLFYAVSGLLLIGFGVSVIGEAIISKMHAVGSWNWVMLGTAGLVLFNSGLSLFGQAVIERIKLINHKKRA